MIDEKWLIKKMRESTINKDRKESPLLSHLNLSLMIWKDNTMIHLK